MNRSQSTTSSYAMVEVEPTDGSTDSKEEDQQEEVEEVEEVEEEEVEEEEEEAEAEAPLASGTNDTPAPATVAAPAPAAASAAATSNTEEQHDISFGGGVPDSIAAAEKPSPEPDTQDKPAVAVEDESFAALRVLEDKLASSFKSALTGLNGMTGGAQTVTEAATNLSKIAGGWTAGLSTGMSWFTGAESTTSSKAARLQLQTSKASTEITTLFNLDDAEQLVESFKCKLLQTYACSHNSFTPAIQMAFQGSLHVTDQHVLFGVEERGKQLPIKVLLKSIKASSRQLPAQKGGSDVLRLELEGGKHVAFKDFESGGSALDSALALIEHLTSPE